jgi:hypothetical protein
MLEAHVKGNTTLLFVVFACYSLSVAPDLFTGLAVLLVLSPLIALCLLLPAFLLSLITVTLQVIGHWLLLRLSSAVTPLRSTR